MLGRKKNTVDVSLKGTGEKYGGRHSELACLAVAVDCWNQSPVCSCGFSGVKNNSSFPNAKTQYLFCKSPQIKAESLHLDRNHHN